MHRSDRFTSLWIDLDKNINSAMMMLLLKLLRPKKIALIPPKHHTRQVPVCYVNDNRVCLAFYNIVIINQYTTTSQSDTYHFLQPVSDFVYYFQEFVHNCLI